MKNILLKFAVFIFTPIVCVLFYGYTLGIGGLPKIEGEFAAEGLTDNVSISRDKYGAVHINAKTDEDAFLALGWAHAQDRIWQMELQKRLARGELSALFGKEYIAVDAHMRTLALYQSAESAWLALSPNAKKSLTAYSAGVNAWLKSNQSLPIEFKVFGIDSSGWSELDSLALSKVFALNLSDSMWSEISRFFAKQYLSGTQFSELFTSYPEDGPLVIDAKKDTVSNLLSMLEFQEKLQDRFKIGGRYVGSNAWVVSAKNSSSGHPILANDPHLGIKIPSIWYKASLKGSKLNSSGMTMVGLPIIIFGHNENIAWGATNMMADDQDLYFEQINGQNPNQYFERGQWKDFDIQKQYIDVRADFPALLKEKIKPVTINVRKTVRGPVISDVFGVFGRPVSLQWTALDRNDTTYESFYLINYASNWMEFNSALSHHVAPALNFLYIDKESNIGYSAAGKIPVRSKGVGITPALGGTGEYEWIGYIPFEELPKSFNPEKGFIISANNKIVPDDYPYHISSEWAPPARAKRIEQLIKSTMERQGSLTFEDMKKMQSDVVSYDAKKLVQVLNSIKTKTSIQKKAQGYIANWNGEMSSGSQAASIFFSWSRHLRELLYKDNFQLSYGHASQEALLRRVFVNVTYDQIADAISNTSGSNWCDNVNTKTVEECNELILNALDMSINELSKLKGSDMEDWKWGNILTAVYSHEPFSATNFLKPFFERRIESSGGPNTVNVSAAKYVESKGFEQYFGAGFRQIISISREETNYIYINSTGQSGNVFSQHYDDMLLPFSKSEYISDEKKNFVAELTLKKIVN